MSLSVPSPASGPQAICSRLGGNREAIQGAPCLCLPRPPRRSEQMAPLPSLHTNQGAPRPSWRRGLVGSALLSQDWSAPSFRPCTPSSLGFCCHIRHFPHLALPSQPPSPIQRGIGEGHALRCHQAVPGVQPVPWVHTQGMTARVRLHSSSEDKANWNPSLAPGEGLLRSLNRKGTGIS